MWAIAQFSLLKMRESAFYLLMIVAAIICVFTNTADPVSEQIAKGSLFSYAFSGEAATQTSSIAMGSCVALIISILISSFYGSSEIPSDINTGVIQVILAKPVGRFNYLGGKYISIVIMAFSIFVFLQLVLFISSYFLKIGVVPYNTVHVALRQFVPALILIPLIAANIAFSIIGGALCAMIFTGLYFLFSVVIAFIPLTMAIFPEGMIPYVDEVLFLIHYIFINPLFYFHDTAATGLPFVSLVFYSLSTAAFFLLISVYLLYTTDMNSAQ